MKDANYFDSNGQWDAADIGIETPYGSFTFAFMASYDKVTIQRTSYKLDNWVANAGGFSGALDTIFVVLCKIFTFDAVYYFLTPQLFDVERKKPKRQKFKS